MPYDIKAGGSGCKGGYEVVGATGTKHGCHKTRASAIQQQRALYAAEADSKKALGKSLFGDLKKEHDGTMTNENVPNRQPHSIEDCQDPQNCPDHMNNDNNDNMDKKKKKDENEFKDKNKNEVHKEEVDKQAPCWEGYVQRGMKPGANGQMVPNCIPVKKSSPDVIFPYIKGF
jgi:hypothetical protein